MTASLTSRDGATQARRRVSALDGVIDNGNTVTVTVKGESFTLTDKQLDEAATRLALEATMTKKSGGFAREQLKSIVERIENLESEKAGIASDIKDIFAEAKSNGYDVPTLRKVIKLRAMDAATRDEADHLLDTYLVSLGMKSQMEMFHSENETEPAVPTADDENLYKRAVEIVRRDQKASTSYVQRMLQIGYNRAACLIDRMEAEGIVGPANHVGKREVLG